MLEKIELIRSVGKYRDFKASKDISFRRLSLIYAQNARGKTTLASIIRSLKTGDVVHLLERASIGSSHPQEVHIRVDGKVVRFASGKWSETLSTIEIFDETFIEDNMMGDGTYSHICVTPCRRTAGSRN
jgi:wobble nucleotide-excising tRNase